MLIFLFSFCVSTCNESALDPGHFCCGEIDCDGHCLKHYNHGKYDYFCVNDQVYLYCGKATTFLIFIGILMAPTVLFILLSIISCTKVSTCTMITNLLLNAGYAVLIEGSYCVAKTDGYLIGIISVSVSYIIIVYIFSRASLCTCVPTCFNDMNINDPVNLTLVSENFHKCTYHCLCCSLCMCCAPKPYDPYGDFPDQLCCCNMDTAIRHFDTDQFIRDARAPIVTMEELKTISEENFSIPPQPCAVATTLFDIKNAQMYMKHVEPIFYGSWQENGVMIPIEKKKIFYHCSSFYKYDHNMDKEIKRANSIARSVYDVPNEAKITFNQYTTEGLTGSAIVAENSCIVPCFKSCFFRFIYEILFLLGYNLIPDFFWYCGSQQIYFNSVKYISADKDLRAMAGERDQFQFDNHSDLKQQIDPISSNSLV